MISRFNHHLLCRKKVVIKFAGHLSETFFNHHLLITMGPCLMYASEQSFRRFEDQKHAPLLRKVYGYYA